MFVKPGTTELLVLQPTTFCNIDCGYCYLPDRASKKRLSIGTLRKVLTNLLADELLASNFELIWHAGEPLTAGKQFFRDANAVLRELVPELMEVQTIQTNGTLIDDQWCALFKDFGIVVGLSLDGPKAIHDAHRVRRSGRGTYDDVMRGIDILRRNEVDFYVICVLTRDSLLNAESILDFARVHGIDRIGFNIEETEGSNLSATLQDPLTRGRARAFYDRAVERALDPGNPIWIREVSEALKQIEAGAFGNVGSLIAEPFRAITVDVAGNWATFCPELMGTETERFGRFVFGNLADGPISSHSDEEKFSRVASEVAAGVKRCESDCDYFNVCGGGRPANKFGEHRRFDVAETEQCRITTKELVNACVSALHRIV